MLLQPPHVETEMENLNLQVASEKRCGNVCPTPLHPCWQV